MYIINNLKIKMKIFKFFTTNIFIIASLFVPSFVFVDAGSDFEYTTNSDAVSVTISSYAGEGGHVNIPSSVTEGEDVYAVTAIGDYAFAGKTTITSVTIPDSLTHIGSGAFIATGLESIDIPNSVTHIGDQAFSSTNITFVIIPDSVTYIGPDAFPALETLTIGGGVKEINHRILYPIENLTNLTLSEGLEKIGSAAFS
ncbi:MAG: leucine-rich repeat domain-containing protein [Candidatus Moranbacteria bacterium]|nr:leucine-rich repeat domain-containing protein [Candidatus Moranbacteria bacterium]